jgi:cold shock CspA family protein
VTLFSKIADAAKASVNFENDVMDEIKEVEKKEEKRITGKIIMVSSKGFGFISSQDVPFTRIFFHWTSLRPDTAKFQDLRSGMKVSMVAFEVESKGWRAIKIKVEE